jgi:hypothetical protein
MAPIDPNTAGTLPGGYAIAGTSLAFQLNTTASVSPPIDVCFNVTTVNDETAFNNLRILHGEGGNLLDRTTTHNFSSRTLCARTTSLSPFLVTPATMNPIDGADYFVTEHYRDFLSREPDASGLAFWIGNITSCGTDQQCLEVKRINTSAAYFLSIEFQQTGYLVERIYKVAYGNAPGSSTLGGAHQLPVPVVRLNEFLPDMKQISQGVVVGQSGWETVLENNKQAFTLDFVKRARFAAAYPTSLTPTQFVNQLFANAEVPASGADYTAAIDEFGGAANTGDVAARARALRHVAENSTLAQQESNRAFVLMQFFGYLRRDPNSGQDTDYTGFDFWLGKLNQFNGNFINAEMVKAFISSIEYRHRFGS